MVKVSFSFYFVVPVSGVCLICIRFFLLIGCAGSVGISLASRVMYMSRFVSPLVEFRAGTSIFGHCGGVDGGTVRIFFSLAL